MTRYQLGRAFEYRVRDYLRDRGYYVIRSAQSKGIADLVAIKTATDAVTGQIFPYVLFVQCKRSGSISKAETHEVCAAANLGCAVPVFARPSDLKSKRGVKLINLYNPELEWEA